MSTSRLGRQIAEAVASFENEGVDFALIGGLALAPHNVIRATQDVDILVDISDAQRIESLLENLGYQAVYQSENAANYQRDDERLDVLYASRPTAKRLLAGARPLQTAFGALRVVSAEGLIGFKLQGLVNDSRRTQDLEDIRKLLAANLDTLNLEEIREYFRLFDRETQFDELLDEIR